MQKIQILKSLIAPSTWNVGVCLLVFQPPLVPLFFPLIQIPRPDADLLPICFTGLSVLLASTVLCLKYIFCPFDETFHSFLNLLYGQNHTKWWFIFQKFLFLCFQCHVTSQMWCFGTCTSFTNFVMVKCLQNGVAFGN